MDETIVAPITNGYENKTVTGQRCNLRTKRTAKLEVYGVIYQMLDVSPGLANVLNSHSRPESVPLPTDELQGAGDAAEDTSKMPSLSNSVPLKTATLNGVKQSNCDSASHPCEDIVGLKDHNASIEKIEAMFDNEISVAEENVRNSFKCVRQLLADRESHLLAELRRTHDEGARFFNERRVLSCELDERAKRMSAMSDREQADLREEIARFVAEKEAEEEIGRAIRYHCDNTQLIKLVKNFGEGDFLV
ncbi:unnamed protein product [Gongylonema pulchrum]|uniref:RAB6-interacting golgin n=1 Tax=Gongylonema pulchrum TaxID=637853 RepID=A0A183D274_9BILA|nr:unnamed protein product [Gongylonema pulchrum]